MIDFILNIDDHLNIFATQYGSWIYLLLFIIIFCETGLIVTPFLPGDSLLFAAGNIAATDMINVNWLAILLIVAAILGDSVNFFIGAKLGTQLLHYPQPKIFRRHYLDQAEMFYRKHGGKAIVLARFIPILRTFAPLVAGIGRMPYPHFLIFNIIGGVTWIVLFIYLGYFFGQIPIVKNNLSLVFLAIIIISLLPMLIKVLRKYRKRGNLSDHA